MHVDEELWRGEHRAVDARDGLRDAEPLILGQVNLVRHDVVWHDERFGMALR